MRITFQLTGGIVAIQQNQRQATQTILSDNKHAAEY